MLVMKVMVSSDGELQRWWGMAVVVVGVGGGDEL